MKEALKQQPIKHFMAKKGLGRIYLGKIGMKIEDPVEVEMVPNTDLEVNLVPGIKVGRTKR